MLAEWMDVGSVALIGFAVALTLLHLSVRPSRSGGQSGTNGQTCCCCYRCMFCGIWVTRLALVMITCAIQRLVRKTKCLYPHENI